VVGEVDGFQLNTDPPGQHHVEHREADGDARVALEHLQGSSDFNEKHPKTEETFGIRKAAREVQTWWM